MRDDLPPGQSSGRGAAVWLPPWALGLGVPVWITGPGQRVLFVNRHAATLFGRAGSACTGRFCFDVVAGLGLDGSRFCRRDCAVAHAAARGEEVAPQRLEIRGRERPGNWTRVVVIPVDPPDGSDRRLVHVAVSAAREWRFEEYLRRVATRSDRDRTRTPLTNREREILDHLACDEDLPTIAKKLFVSHVTVRNHVQHILQKLGTHSVLESIALHLLGKTGAADSGQSPAPRPPE